MGRHEDLIIRLRIAANVLVADLPGIARLLEEAADALETVDRERIARAPKRDPHESP